MSAGPASGGRRFVAPLYERHDVDAIIAACSPRAPTGIGNRPLIALLYRAALRTAGALALRPGDVDDERAWSTCCVAGPHTMMS